MHVECFCKFGEEARPRKLDIPGEDLPKIVWRLESQEQVDGQDILVFTGEDKALEADVSLAEDVNARACLSYWGKLSNSPDERTATVFSPQKRKAF